MKGGSGRLMGFGHRVYKSYDPRAKIVKKLAYEVFESVGMDKDLEIALELERIALSGRLFRFAQAVSERGFLHRADLPGDGVPDGCSSPCCSRSRARPAGWRSGRRCCNDKEQKIARPRQIYTGYGERPYTSKIK